MRRRGELHPARGRSGDDARRPGLRQPPAALRRLCHAAAARLARPAPALLRAGRVVLRAVFPPPDGLTPPPHEPTAAPAAPPEGKAGADAPARAAHDRTRRPRSARRAGGTAEHG